MAEINLGNDTTLNVSLGNQTNLAATVYDINYIPDYIKAEQERRANEAIRISNENTRQSNEADRIALYEDLENKRDTDYWRGATGATPDIHATASISGGTGTPGVTVTRSGTDEEPNLSFAFTNLKGDKGDKGDAGAVKFLIVPTLPTEDIQEDTIYLVPIEGETGNNYEEYMYVNGQWEKLGGIQVEIDLTDYVKFTDYATSSKGGVLIMDNGLWVNPSTGKVQGVTQTYANYQNLGNNYFLAKGTLENVITGKGLITNTDYANGTTAGVIKNNNGILINSNGFTYGETLTYDTYTSKGNQYFISKGTLENVLNTRIGDIDAVLDAINGEIL